MPDLGSAWQRAEGAAPRHQTILSGKDDRGGDSTSDSDVDASPSSRSARAKRYVEAMATVPEKDQTRLDGVAPARTGRLNQVFKDGERLCVGVIPIFEGRVLLISSRKREEWILPKGGWEADETMEEAALREAYEEAGVRGHLVTPDKLFRETLHANSHGVPCRTRFFVLDVTSVLEQWPEMHRQRQFVECTAALSLLKRPMLQEAITLALDHPGKARALKAHSSKVVVAVAAVSFAFALHRMVSVQMRQ